MRTQATLTILLGLALVATACDDDEPTRPSAISERHENGALRIDERQILASVDDAGGVSAEILLEPTREGAVRGVVEARLAHLDPTIEGTFEAARRSFSAEAASGPVIVPLDLPGAIQRDADTDLALYTIDYRITVEGHDDLYGRRSLWAAVPRLEAQVVGPDTYDVGVSSALRIIVRDPGTGQPVPGAKVRIAYERPEREDAEAESRNWFVGETDEHGQLAAPVEPGEEDAGEGNILVAIEAKEGGEATVRSPVHVGRSRRILLTTDKPLYQPSQTVHLRALALGRGDRAAQAVQEVIFEVEDAKGNKVFKHRAETDGFGIAAADFKLAREVNMGRFKLRAIMGEDISEKTVTVDRYSLPKFAIDLGLDRSWYRPGATVHGTLRATYTFGKPVTEGAVTVRAQTLDVGLNTFAEVRGTTDAGGNFAFEVQIPNVIVGVDLAQGAGIISFEAEVTDTAEHTQARTTSARVADGDVQVVVVPESGQLVQGSDNVLYIQTTDPGGLPLAARVEVVGEGIDLETRTGDDGFGQVTVPVAGGSLSLQVTARSDDGGLVRRDLVLEAGSVEGGLLLRTDKALYSVGETMQVQVRAPDTADRLYLDMVRDHRTVLTHILEVEDGLGEAEIDLGDDLSGSLSISVYYLTDSSEILRDLKVVFVDAADGLSVRVEPELDLYAPGDTARVHLRVRDKDDQPVTAALGLQVVDEAVFALTEMKPGLAETFFAIEGALQEPKVSVEGWSAHRVVAGGEAPEERDRAAQMLFAAADGVASPIDRNTHREAVVQMPGLLAAPLTADLQAFTDAIGSMIELGVLTPENLPAYLEAASNEGAWSDPWGQGYRFEQPTQWQLNALSFGPDEVEGTVDDVSIDIGGAAKVANGGMGGPMAGGGGARGGDFGDEMDADGAFDEGAPPAAPTGEAEEPQAPGDPDANGGGAPRRVRRYFPETLLSAPSIITDGNGEATLELPLADSITTWRASAMANTADGRIGSTVGSVRVFQDFFIDPDLPPTLTRGDEISVPVAVYNYLEQDQDIEVSLLAAQGFSLLGADREVLSLGPSEVRSISFRLRAEDVGFASVTVWGRGDGLEDAVERTVEIVPDGKEIRTAKQGRLDGPVTVACDVPEQTVPGSGRCFTKIYPGLLSQAVEGLDGVLRMPFG